MRKNKIMISTLIVLLLIMNISSVSVFASTATGDTVAAVDLNSKEEAQTHTVEYSKAKTCVIPITIPTGGTFLIDLVGDGGYAQVKVTDENGKLLKKGKLTPAGYDKTIGVRATTAGTYYLEFSTDSSQTLHTSFCLYYAPTVGVDLSDGRIYYTGGVADLIPCYTFKAPSDGYITVDFAESMLGYGFVNMWVCDPIVNNTIPDDAFELETDKGKGYIGVKKGDYSLNICSGDLVYGIKASFTPVKNSGGSTRSKAQLLKKGTLKKGISIVDNPSSKEWYKFTLKKAQVVKFNLHKKNNNRVIAFRFYREGKKKSFLYKDVRNRRNSSEFYVSKGDTKNKLAAGTYYVEVDNKGTGYYDLTWMK